LKISYRLQNISDRRTSRLVHVGIEQRNRILPDASRNERIESIDIEL